MLKLFARQHDQSSAKRVVEVGWLLQTESAGFIWDAPRGITREDIAPQHAKSVGFCPAVLDHEARLFEIACPFDLHLRFRFEADKPVLINAAGDQSAIRAKHLGQVASLVGRKEWRHPARPIIQILTPYTFVADEAVYMAQLPPFVHYRDPPWPGVLIGGRLPIHIWPRQLMWAFEWYDVTKDLVLERGEPWFYVRFETSDASRQVRLEEATLTPELKDYISGLSGVTNYVRRTFSLFPTALQRRPQRLFIKRRSTAR